MGALDNLMRRGIISPLVHGLLDYPLAAVLLAGPGKLKFDSRTAAAIARVFGAGAAVLAVGTDWQTSIVRVIPPWLHGYADVTVTGAMLVLPVAAGFTDDTKALVFYEVVGAGGLAATLATRFPPRKSTRRRGLGRAAWAI